MLLDQDQITSEQKIEKNEYMITQKAHLFGNWPPKCKVYDFILLYGHSRLSPTEAQNCFDGPNK